MIFALREIYWKFISFYAFGCKCDALFFQSSQ